MKIQLGKIPLEATLLPREGINKEGRAYKALDVIIEGVKVGTLWGRFHPTLTLSGVEQDTAYSGDLYIQGTTSALKQGDVHPETGLRVVEHIGKGEVKYLTLEGEILGATRVFYKSATGTLTVALIVK